ncbi:MAG: deoxyribonuclease IV, partial [Dysgonamonadaceae bacterium]
FEMIIKDDRFNNMPLILETPIEDLWAEEIEMLYKLK